MISASRQAELDGVGLPAKEWALVGLNGNDIYTEARGHLAGYLWHQYAVHRGELQMLMHRKVVERIGPDAVRLGARVTGYRKLPDGGVSVHITHSDGTRSDLPAAMLIGADGIHSAVRAQMHPGQPPHPLGRQHHVARRDVGETHPDRRVFRGAGHAQASHRVLSDLAPGSADRARADQLDRRGHQGSRRREAAQWLVPPGAHRVVPAQFCRLDLGLARRAGADSRRRGSHSRIR